MCNMVLLYENAMLSVGGANLLFSNIQPPPITFVMHLPLTYPGLRIKDFDIPDKSSIQWSLPSIGVLLLTYIIVVLRGNLSI